MSDLVVNLHEYLSTSSLLAYPAAFLAGVAISFTPCVYPRHSDPTRLYRRANNSNSRNQACPRSRVYTFRLFVIGMAAVYAALGAFASLTGALFGVWAASPWTYIIVGNVILVFALSMLDVFQLPTSQFLANWNPARKGGGHVSALLIGAASGLVVGPCTAPALGAALAYVGTRGNVVFDTSVLFVFALGMGVLMIVLGTFGGALVAMPRSGQWMVRIKKGFGVVMIIIAEYLLLQAGQRFI